mmetsp:Transcript_22414/g.32107  ORF Transcript_22414/g.32107 Transcript_22414/m.32107 type:complete len:99 (-) Transcript_22414:345-641(-)
MKSFIRSAIVLILLLGKEAIGSGVYLRLKSSQRQLKGGSSEGKKQPPPPVDWQERLPTGNRQRPPPQKKKLLLQKTGILQQLHATVTLCKPCRIPSKN